MNKYDFTTTRGSLTRLAVRALDLEKWLAQEQENFENTGLASTSNPLVEGLSNVEYALTDELHTIHSFRLAIRRQEAVQEQAQLEAALSRSQGRMENLSEEVVRLARERTELERLLNLQKLSGIAPFFDIGGKIPTIKVVRERHNVGLKEAKDLVDSWPIFWGSGSIGSQEEPRFLTPEEDAARKTIHPFDNGQNEVGYFLICALTACGKQKDAPIHQVPPSDELLAALASTEVNPFLQKAIEDVD